MSQRAAPDRPSVNGLGTVVRPCRRLGRFGIRSISELHLQRANTWLVKGVLPSSGWGLVYGKSGAGKSFVALDLAAHVALGADWNGRRVKRAGVVYAGLEGGADVENRLLALRDSLDGLNDASLGLTTLPLDLLDREDKEALVEEISASSQGGDVPIRLVIIDTLARAAGGADENSAAEMTQLVNAAEEIGRELSAFVLIVHHAPWEAKRPRGSSALYGAADVILAVEKDGEERSLRVEKQKAGREGEQWRFELTPVALGEDEDGDPITSCVLRWRQGVTTQRQSRLSHGATLVMRALNKLVDAKGVERRGHAMEMVRAVRREDWTQASIGEGATAAQRPKDQRCAVRRIEKGLIARGLVAIEGEWVWPCDKATGGDTGATVAHADA